MTHPSGTAPAAEPSARLLPQSVGVIANVAGLSALIAGGGTLIVLTGAFGAILAGAYIVWKRWRGTVDRAVIAGFIIAVAGAGFFGYALAEPGGNYATSPPPSPNQSGLGNNGTNTTQPDAAAPSLAPEAIWLADMTAVDGGDGWEHGPRTVNTQRYERSVVGATCSTDDWTEDFNIERQFSRFQATIGIANDAPTETATSFTVILDGNEIFRRDLRLGEQADVDIPVTGGLRLVLQVDTVGLTQCSSTAVWGDALLRR